MNRYSEQVETVVPVKQEYAEQTERDRSHLFTAGVVGVLLLFAFITGVLVSSVVGVFAWLLKSVIWWKFSLATLASVSVIAWLVLLARWLRLVAPIERLLHADIDGDGSIGEPEPVKTVRIELKHDDGHLQFLDLPYAERIPDFFKSLNNGSPLSESAWCGAGALFSKREFYTLRDEMLKRGIIRWRNPDAPAQGLDLTPGGRAIVRYYANPPSNNP